MAYAKRKDSDQPMHQRSLIGIFEICTIHLRSKESSEAQNEGL